MGHNASERAFPQELTGRHSVWAHFPFLNFLGIALAALLAWPMLARGQQPLPQSPDSDGRIQYLGTLPLADHPPGLYMLRVAIPAGGKVVTRGCRFFLVPQGRGAPFAHTLWNPGLS